VVLAVPSETLSLRSFLLLEFANPIGIALQHVRHGLLLCNFAPQAVSERNVDGAPIQKSA